MAMHCTNRTTFTLSTVKATIAQLLRVTAADERRTRRVENTRYLFGLMNQIVSSRVSSPRTRLASSSLALHHAPPLLPPLSPASSLCFLHTSRIPYSATRHTDSRAHNTPIRMATAAPIPRNPLATRPQEHNTGMSISPCRTTLKRTNQALKRPHSPEPVETPTDHSSKRVKTTPSAPVVQESPTPAVAARAEAKKEKERRQRDVNINP